MKNKFARVAAVLIIASVLLLVACNGDGRPGDADTMHEGVQERAEVIAEDYSHLFPDVEVTQKIRWLSWYALDENAPTAEIFRAVYGVPDEDGGDNIIHFMNVAYEDRLERLSALIASGDSPDMFQFEERHFPFGAYMRQFDPVDDLFDFDAPEWEATRDVMRLFEWGGHNYAPIHMLVPSTALLFYRNSVVQQAGLPDPYELWNRGEWDWNAFLDMCQQFTDPANNMYSIMGWFIDEAAILSTGIGILTIEDGLLQNNLDDRRLDRAMDFLHGLAINDHRFPYHEVNNFELNPAEFRNGNILFWNDGPWVYQQTLTRFRERDGWADDEVRIVPFPRDPHAAQFYHRGKHDSFMLVAGSRNHEGYKAWVTSALIAAQDGPMETQARDRMKEVYHWTEHQLEVLDRIQEESVLVWDFKNGIGADIACAVSDSPVENLTKPVIVEGESFTQVREENRGVIEPRIARINRSVTGGNR